MSANAPAAPIGSSAPIAVTDRGTPVYMLEEPWPEGSIPMMRRGLGNPPPRGVFARFLHAKYAEGSCVIVRHRRSVRIFKLFREGEVHAITARSIRLEDRKRLVAQGILQRS